jgi:hypothetical protein
MMVIGQIVTLILLAGAFRVPAVPEKAPEFWRGVYLFGIHELHNPADREAFFVHLRDSLRLNIFQVRTYGHPERVRYFLKENAGLWVIVQDQQLAASVDDPDPDRRNAAIARSVEQVKSYPRSLRIYLKDEPRVEDFERLGNLSDSIQTALARVDDRVSTTTTLAVGGDAIQRYVETVAPRELMIDPYFITNNIPHPSLRGNDYLSSRMRILPWGEEKDGYGWYLGYLQQAINKALAEQYRPAAAAVSGTKGRTRLILVPQLHGVFFRSTGGYDADARLHDTLYLRPPAPSEIRLQYALGIAYGAKGFLAYPYGYDVGFESSDRTYPGLVSRDVSAVSHETNFDTLFGRNSVWTGYHEKWREFSALNGWLESLEDSLVDLTWVGAKSWTMTRDWRPTVTNTPFWDERIVTGVGVNIRGDRFPELPQVEIGQLRNGDRHCIVVVNRRCAPRDRARIRVTLGYHASWRVTRLGTDAREWRVSPGGSFTDSFAPGEGRVYVLDELSR